jgi:hypothetical protein
LKIVALNWPVEADLLSEARYASGFGCIRCGCTVFRYCAAQRDDAVTELAPHPFLLCPPCLDLFAAGLPDATFAAIRARPLALQREFDHARLPYLPAERGLDIPDVSIAGGITMRGTGIPIVFGGVPVIVIAPPEIPGGAINLTISLGDGSGAPVRLIEGNEWVAPEGWRFAHVGRHYQISRGDRAWLELSYHPRSGIALEELRTSAGGRVLTIDASGARLDGAPVTFPPASARVIGVTL